MFNLFGLINLFLNALEGVIQFGVSVNGNLRQAGIHP